MATVNTAPSGPKPSSSSGSSRSKSSGSSRSKSSGGGGGGGGDPYLAAQRKAQSKSNQRYLDQAAALEKQARALRYALGDSGVIKALEQKLSNIQLTQVSQDRTIMEGYGSRVGQLKGSAQDNEKASAGAEQSALVNRGRERANAVSEAMLQGAGESDVLRSQLMSLRNWESNQSEAQRSYFDTQRSINASLTDLNADTKTARTNIQIEANADREQLWSAYYDQRSELRTSLGNLYGQQAELYGYANEQVGSRKTRSKMRHAQKAMGENYMRASELQSKAWDNPGISSEIQGWKGEGEIKGQNNLSKIENLQTAESKKRPEGATLRSW